MTQTEQRPRSVSQEVTEKPQQTFAGLTFAGAPGGWLKENSCFIAIVLCATATALAYHFVFGHPKSTLIYDARSYLWTSARIAEFLIDLTHLQWHPQLIVDAQFQEHVINDGPLYTSFIGSVFALFQNVPEVKDWAGIEIIQSILHGFAAGFIYLITRRLLESGASSASPDSQQERSAGPVLQKSKQFDPGLGAVAAGLIWGLYPAGSVASGFLYTEPLVVCVTSLFMWIAVSGKPGLLRDAATGIAAGLVVLLKPALAPAAVISCLARVTFAPKKMAAIVSMAIALACTLAPWALYTHFVCGKMQITTPRFANYNMAMGADTEAEGRLVIPCTALTNIFREDDKAVYFVASQWTRHTAECLQMTGRKLTRLLGFQWNDFRHSFFGLNATQQRMLHIALLFFGLAGCALAVVTRKLEKASMPIVVAMAFMWTPLVYLLFESNSRYGYTIMPLYAVFAGYLIGQLTGSSWRKNLKPAALSMVAGGILTVGILQAGTLASTGLSGETRVIVAPQNELVSTVDLSRVKQPVMPYEALIMVDADRSSESASLEFNGHKLDSALANLRYFDSGLYDGFYVSKEMGHFMKEDGDDFRQWRAVRVPKDWIDWSGKNEIRIAAGSRGCTIYGDTHANPEVLPSFRHFCPNKLCNTDSGLETRLSLMRPSRITDHTAVIKSASSVPSSQMEPRPVSGSARVRMAIVLDSARVKKAQQSVSSYPLNLKQPPHETPLFSESLQPERFNVIMRSADNDGTIRTSKFTVKRTAPAIEIKLPPPASGDNLFKIKLTGKFKGIKPGPVSALINNGKFTVLSKTPSFMMASKDWQTFEIEDTMPARLLRDDAGNFSVSLALYPGPWVDESALGASRSSSDVLFRDLSLDVSSTRELNLAGKVVYVY